MSLTLQVQVSDEATTALGPLLASLAHRERINQEAATAVADTIVKHLDAFESGGDRHKSAQALDAEPSGFWGRMAAGVSGSATADEARVTMPREMAQRYFGGTLRPTGGKQFLAIPAMAEAYGRGPREFQFLIFGFGMLANGHMAPALIDLARSSISITKDRRKGATPGALRAKPGETTSGGHVYFWLVSSATQKRDPSVLPTEAAMTDAARTAIGEYLTRQGGLSS